MTVFPGYAGFVCALTHLLTHTPPSTLLPPPFRPQVLRKQPPGTLLRGAHAVDREYRIMRALAGHVPVPTVRHLCEDR